MKPIFSLFLFFWGINCFVSGQDKIPFSSLKSSDAVSFFNRFKNKIAIKERDTYYKIAIKKENLPLSKDQKIFIETRKEVFIFSFENQMLRNESAIVICTPKDTCVMSIAKYSSIMFYLKDDLLLLKVNELGDTGKQKFLTYYAINIGKLKSYSVLNILEKDKVMFSNSEISIVSDVFYEGNKVYRILAIPHGVRICAKRDKKRASRVRLESTKTQSKCLPSTSAKPTLNVQNTKESIIH